MKTCSALIGSVILSILLSLSAAAIQPCTTEIPGNTFQIDGTAYQAGDVICLLAGNKDYLLLQNIQGTEAQPITITNKGGAVLIDTDHFYGIKFYNCKHIILSGSGVEGLDYGIQVKRVGAGAGISIDYYSSNVEIESVEIAHTAIAGIYAKTEPFQGDCDQLVTRDNFTMFDLKIHDCYLHDIADEGLYIGSSKYTGQVVHQCNDVVVLPHVIEGVEIYNNIIEHTGWDGIQVSSAPVDCSIHDNIVRNDSYAAYPGQMSGILIGGGSKCDCYNNKIYDGTGDGIDVFGMGFMKIYNNLIVRAGKTFEPGNPTAFKSGIYIGKVEGALSPGATFSVYQNTIISPKSFGITYNNDAATMGYVANNLITDPGYYSVSGDASFVNLNVMPSLVSQQNNYKSTENSAPKFIDAASDNYDLKPSSPAVNYGKDLLAEGIEDDIEGRERPWHTYFDAGAYESHDPGAAVEDQDVFAEILGLAYPNPASHSISIPVKVSEKQDVVIIIVNQLGQTILLKRQRLVQQHLNTIKLDVSTLSPGYYYYGIIFNKGSQYNPLIIQQISD